MPTSLPRGSITYAPRVEAAADSIQALLRADYGLSHRAVALLALQGDQEVLAWIESQEGTKTAELVREHVRKAMDGAEAPGFLIHTQLQDWVAELVAAATTGAPDPQTSFADRLGKLCTSPITGIPIALIVVYFALYQFVGIFGGGTLVGWLEEGLFGTYINPWITSVFENYVPWTAVRELFVGEYGVFTLGVTYAVALILPIVGCFFLAFAILEDSGYLPRLAMLLDRLFKLIGLNGRAVIPIVLGFGCDTMATITTRILETRRERVIATFLLSLTIPCAAQLGVIMALLSTRTAEGYLLGVPIRMGALVWGAVLFLIFTIAGLLAARVTPGSQTPFVLELPPMRPPRLANVLTKTLSRLHWYFLEVFPLFVYASVMIWVGLMTGLFDRAIALLEPVVRFVGLPSEAATAFMFGFFRRDYGAAGLMKTADSLSGVDLVTAAVVLTLFLPCIAQFLVVWKERGWRMALGIGAITFSSAILVGALLSRILEWTGLRL